MKTSKIVKIMKQDRSIILCSTEGMSAQWGGNGGCLYNLEGMPTITNMDEFGILYDIPEKKRCEYFFSLRSMPDGYDMSDYAPGEEMAELYETRISSRDRDICAVRGEGGTILLVGSRYLEPFCREDGVEYMIRDSEFGKILCVRQEMELKTIIMPVKMMEKGKDRGIAHETEIIWREMRRQIREAEEQAEQR